jgi:hypothetical protein
MTHVKRFDIVVFTKSVFFLISLYCEVGVGATAVAVARQPSPCVRLLKSSWGLLQIEKRNELVLYNLRNFYLCVTAG